MHTRNTHALHLQLWVACQPCICVKRWPAPLKTPRWLVVCSPIPSPSWGDAWAICHPWRPPSATKNMPKITRFLHFFMDEEENCPKNHQMLGPSDLSYPVILLGCCISHPSPQRPALKSKSNWIYQQYNQIWHNPFFYAWGGGQPL